jgi:Protein of unknown function (DUF2800)
MAGHSLLSPSGASRWLACTPSARFEEQHADAGSRYANEGTLAHEVAALVLGVRSGVAPVKNFPAVLSEIEHRVNAFYSQMDRYAQPSRLPEFGAMLEHAEEYAAFVLEQAQGQILIEQRYDLRKFVPFAWGTADCTNITKDTIYVTDYKYGAGVAVTATANPQLMLYALGAWNSLPVDRTYDIKNVVVSIFQPRAGGSSSWSVTSDELLKWANEVVIPRAKMAMGGQGEFVAGSHCQFCKVKTVCKAWYDRFGEAKRLKDSRVMSDDDLSRVLEFGDEVKGWIEKVKEDTVRRLAAGEKIPGWKLVAGRGARTWKSEDDVVVTLLDEGFESYDIYNTKLKGIGDMETLVGKKRFTELLEDKLIKVPGKPALAKDDDKRKPLGESLADEYD